MALVTALVLALPVGGSLASASQSVSCSAQTTNVMVGGQMRSVSALNCNGSLYVPLRSFGTLVGKKVGYNAATHVVTLAAGTVAASTGAQVKVATSSKYGKILVDASGRTLYVFTKDSKDKSVCYGACAAIWPALLSIGTPSGTGVTGSLGLIARTSGGHQVTCNGQPLYTFSGDSAAGQTNGEGFKGIWWVVSPSCQAIHAAVSSTSTY